jgi:hypothetical protein
MPAFQSTSVTQRRSLQTVIALLHGELKRIAEEEGEDALMLVRYCDVSADFVHDQKLIVKVDWQNKTIWWAEIKMSEHEMLNLADGDFKDTVTRTMRGTLSLAGQKHHARLELMFPKAIEKVDVAYNAEKDCKMVAVRFKNGHIATATEHEAKTDLFTARCAMLYDLPPI